MPLEIQIFHSFAESDRADERYYAALSPQERLNILLSLITRQQELTGETPTRFERVYRVTERSRG